MRMLVPQVFMGVRRKIDDREAPPLLQHARGLRKRQFRLLEKVQNLVDGDQIVVARVKRQVQDVTVADARRQDALLVEIGARDGEHVPAGINANGPTVTR